VSYSRPLENGYYGITGTPAIVIGRRTWDRTCLEHGLYVGRSPNQSCPVCKVARKAAREARISTRVLAAQAGAGKAARGLGTPGGRDL
jgi:hypothetical protein